MPVCLKRRTGARPNLFLLWCVSSDERMYAALKYDDRKVIKSLGALFLPRWGGRFAALWSQRDAFGFLLRRSSDNHLSVPPWSVPRMRTFHLASSFTGNRSIGKKEMQILLLHVILKQWSNL